MKVIACALAVIAAVALSTIATAEPRQRRASFDGMTLNLDRMQVVTPNWTSPLVDCSDETVECLEAPGHFLISMQRQCARDFEWEAGGFGYRALGIMPHYGLPSASYMSMKYPNVHWWFGAPVSGGFTRWARTSGTPFDPGWSTNDVLEEYQVRTVGGTDWFRCA